MSENAEVTQRVIRLVLGKCVVIIGSERKELENQVDKLLADRDAEMRRRALEDAAKVCEDRVDRDGFRYGNRESEPMCNSYTDNKR